MARDIITLLFEKDLKVEIESKHIFSLVRTTSDILLRGRQTSSLSVAQQIAYTRHSRSLSHPVDEIIDGQSSSSQFIFISSLSLV